MLDYLENEKKNLSLNNAYSIQTIVLYSIFIFHKMYFLVYKKLCSLITF